MPLNIYMKLNKILNKDQIEKLDSFLSFQYEAHVSCNDIANSLDITYENAKKIVRILLKEDILKMSFRIYCKNELDTCDQATYESIEDIPDEPCSNCERGCSILKNVIIVYKVITEGINGR